MKKLVLLVPAFAVLSCSGNTPTEPSFSAAIQEAQNAAFEVARAAGTSVGVALVTRDRGGLAGG